MKLHANAALTSGQRRRIVLRVLEQQWVDRGGSNRRIGFLVAIGYVWWCARTRRRKRRG